MTAVAPRRLGLEELISVLIAEHAEIRQDLVDLERSAERRDYSSSAMTLERLDRLFRQHVADEEAQVLRFLIEAYGVKGANEAILVFRQHRPIYRLMTEVKELVSLSPEELALSEAKLKSMLETHAQAEETDVFPRALSTFNRTRENPGLRKDVAR